MTNPTQEQVDAAQAKHTDAVNSQILASLGSPGSFISTPPTPYYGFTPAEWNSFNSVYKSGVRQWAYDQAGQFITPAESQAWTSYITNGDGQAVDNTFGPEYKYKSFFQNTKDLSNMQNFQAAENSYNAVNGTRGYVKPGTIDSLSALQTQLKIGNNSYSGCDITPSITVGGKTWVIGNLSALSYSVHRDKVPVRTLGRSYVKSYVSGGVTIAGTLIFTVFDTHVLDDIRTYMVTEVEAAGGQSSPLTQQLPPFDVTIFFRNEYGHASYMRIYGIEITDESQTHSINDIYTENQMQYVARDIDLMTSDRSSKTPQYLGGGNVPSFSQFNMATPAYRLNTIQANAGQIGQLQASNASITSQLKVLEDKESSLEASDQTAENINLSAAYQIQYDALEKQYAANKAQITALQAQVASPATESQVGDPTSVYGSTTSDGRDNPYSMTRAPNTLTPNPTTLSTINQSTSSGS